VIAAFLVAAAMWQTDAALPLARSEVAGANWRGSAVVVGGFTADGASSARVDAYNSRIDEWTRLPDLPIAVNHPMAAAGGGRLFVFGGYGAGGARRDAFVYDRGRWRRLPPMPFARAAGGAAWVDNVVYVVGGIGPLGVARSMLAYDIRRARWRRLGGPQPREHLGVTAMHGWLYAVGGRVAGQPFATVERWSPRGRRWRRLASLPEPRGGTAAGVANGFVISAGAESSAGTSGAVYAYTPRTKRWRRLPDLPTPRHGLAVIGVDATIHVVAGGPQPGLSVSAANESFVLTG
jgi:N-acetylneuraminic acid mutarotase